METLIQRETPTQRPRRRRNIQPTLTTIVVPLARICLRWQDFAIDCLRLDKSTFIQILYYLKNPLRSPPPQYTDPSFFYLYFRPPIHSILYSFDCTDFSEPNVSQNLQVAPFLLCGWSGLQSCYNSSVLMHAYIKGKIKANILSNAVKLQSIYIIQSISGLQMLYF